MSQFLVTIKCFTANRESRKGKKQNQNYVYVNFDHQSTVIQISLKLIKNNYQLHTMCKPKIKFTVEKINDTF